MKGFVIALAVIFLLAILPLGVSVKYDAAGALVRLIAGPIRITLFPMKKKEKKEKPESNKKQAKQANLSKAKPAEEKPKEEKPSGGPITDFLPLVRVALDFLDDFRRKLRVDVLELKVILAGDDPCDLATNYGRAWTALGNLWPRLEEFLVIKKRNVEVECDFLAAKTTVYARLDLTITLGRLLAMVFVGGVKAVVTFLKIMNKRKGGNEQ